MLDTALGDVEQVREQVRASSSNSSLIRRKNAGGILKSTIIFGV